MGLPFRRPILSGRYMSVPFYRECVQCVMNCWCPAEDRALLHSTPYVLAVQQGVGYITFVFPIRQYGQCASTHY